MPPLSLNGVLALAHWLKLTPLLFFLWPEANLSPSYFQQPGLPPLLLDGSYR